MRKKIIGSVAALFLAFTIGCGAGDTGSSTSSGDGGTSAATSAASKNAPATVAAGQPMTLTESLFGQKTVVTITVSNVQTNVKSGNQFIKASNGQFITADVLVEVKEGKYSITSGSFKLVGADGTAYNPTTMLNSKDLLATDLTPGNKASGQIVFDAAAGAEKGGRIALTSILADGDAGYWTL